MQFTPNKIVTIRKGDQPWYTNLLRTKRRQRDRLFRHAKLKNTNEAWSKYRRIRNEYIHCLALSKAAYENKQISNLELEDIGGRGWWQTIKQHIGNSKSHNMPALLLPSGEAVHDKLFMTISAKQVRLTISSFRIPQWTTRTQHCLLLNLSQKVE